MKTALSPEDASGGRFTFNLEGESESVSVAPLKGGAEIVEWAPGIRAAIMIEKKNSEMDEFLGMFFILKTKMGWLLEARNEKDEVIYKFKL